MDKADIELRKHKFIVLSQDHYNPLDVIRSLGEKELKPISILYGEHQWMIPHCKYVEKLYQVETLEEGYKILMEKYGNEIEKPFLYCSDDTTTSFLDQRYDDLKDKFYLYNAGEKGRITWLQNKYNITRLATEVGLIIPKSEVVETGTLPTTLKYPVITKVLASTMGAWKGDVYICENEDQLLDAFKKIKSPKLIIQEYIRKKNEFDMEGFSINDGQDVFFPFVNDYVRLYDNSYGHYMTFRPFEDKELRKKLCNLFKLTKFNGIFEIEFMLGPNNEQYFLEINLRASTWNYAINVGGGNMPYYWAKSTLLGRIPYEEMNLRKDPFTAMVEPADFQRNVWKVGLITWLRQCITSDCHYYYNNKDKAPLFYYILNRLLKNK